MVSENIDFDDFAKTIEFRLKKELPGFNAQKTMSPSIREDLVGNTAPNSTTRQSAVLILLFSENGQTNTLFIKRPVYNGPHSGQVSFPGGKFDDNDTNIQATALRETDEEVGINSTDIRILGTLTPLYIPISNMMVHPFVGALNHTPTFHPNLQEVEYIIKASLKTLANPKNKSVRVITSHEKIITAPYYNINNEFIWGATAMILAEFLEAIPKSFRH